MLGPEYTGRNNQVARVVYRIICAAYGLEVEFIYIDAICPPLHWQNLEKCVHMECHTLQFSVNKLMGYLPLP